MAAAWWSKARPLLALGAAPALGAAAALRSYGPVQGEEAKKKDFQPLKCVSNQPHTHDTRKITFATVEPLPQRTAVVNVAVRAPLGDVGANVTRMYNPITNHGDTTLTLLVKKYADAKMGTHLHSLKAGDTVEIKGPNQQWKFQKGKYDEYALVAGGTGITPLIQVAETVLDNDTAKVKMICANKTAGDRLLLEELAALKKAYPGRLTVEHLVEGSGQSKPSDSQALKKLLPPPTANVLVMVCGKPGMTAGVAGPKTKDFKQGEVGGALQELGYSSAQVWKL